MFAEETNEEKLEKKDTSLPEKKDKMESTDEVKPDATDDKAEVVKNEKPIKSEKKSEKKLDAEKTDKDASTEQVKSTEKSAPQSESKDAKTPKAEDTVQVNTEDLSKPKKEIKIDESRKGKTESGRFEKRKTERKRIDRRGLRQGIRREEYRSKSYDALPARDQNIKEIINTGNPDLINRTAEDYAKTWGDRPPWVKNRFSSFQIRPIISKILKIKKQTFSEENVNELKLLKPLIAYIARRYHDDDLYEFSRIIRYAIDDVGDNPQKFKHFCSFFDSLLMYFRANGGK